MTAKISTALRTRLRLNTLNILLTQSTALSFPLPSAWSNVHSISHPDKCMIPSRSPRGHQAPESTFLTKPDLSSIRSGHDPAWGIQSTRVSPGPARLPRMASTCHYVSSSGPSMTAAPQRLTQSPTLPLSLPFLSASFQ